MVAGVVVMELVELPVATADRCNLVVRRSGFSRVVATSASHHEPGRSAVQSAQYSPQQRVLQGPRARHPVPAAVMLCMR